MEDKKIIDVSEEASKENFLKARCWDGKMRELYRILDPKLGEGAYGEVRKCVYKDKSIIGRKSAFKEFRAVKILSKDYMEDKDVRNF